jgi:hypothetical protein
MPPHWVCVLLTTWWSMPNAPAAAVEKRFTGKCPHRMVKDGDEPRRVVGCRRLRSRETLEWDTVRVVRYRQHKPDGTVVQADWLIRLPARNSLLLISLLTLRALIIGRLSRLRYVHRVRHAPPSAFDLVRHTHLLSSLPHTCRSVTAATPPPNTRSLSSAALEPLLASLFTLSPPGCRTARFRNGCVICLSLS